MEQQVSQTVWNSKKINEVYCCIWSDFDAGHGANKIASGLVVILEKVLDTYPDICQLITLSDSCVSLNWNSIISFAIQDVLEWKESFRA